MLRKPNSQPSFSHGLLEFRSKSANRAQPLSTRSRHLSGYHHTCSTSSASRNKPVSSVSIGS